MGGGLFNALATLEKGGGWVVVYGILDLDYIYNYNYNYNYDYNYTTHYITIKDSIIHDNAMQHSTVKYSVVQVHLFRKEKGGYHAMQGNAVQCSAMQCKYYDFGYCY